MSSLEFIERSGMNLNVQLNVSIPFFVIQPKRTEQLFKPVHKLIRAFDDSGVYTSTQVINIIYR